MEHFHPNDGKCIVDHLGWAAGSQGGTWGKVRQEDMDTGGPGDNSQQERLLPSFQEWLPPSHEFQQHQEKAWLGFAHRTLGCSETGDTRAGPHLALSQSLHLQSQSDAANKSGVKFTTVVHSCLTLCDPMECSPPSSSVHGIVQASILEWVAISFSRGFF